MLDYLSIKTTPFAKQKYTIKKMKIGWFKLTEIHKFAPVFKTKKTLT